MITHLIQYYQEVVVVELHMEIGLKELKFKDKEEELYI